EAFDIGPAEGATALCAQLLLRGAVETLRGAIERVRAAAATDVGKIEEESRRDRERCVDALSVFLKRHDLPQMWSELRLQQQSGVSYATRLYVKALGGLAAVIELEIPPGHLLSSIARVEKLVERLEVHAPESGGWLRKEVKLRAQRLDKEFITALVSGAQETLIHLRAAADGTGVGFDLIIRNNQRVKLSRIGEAGDLPPFDLDDTDSAKVREFRDKLLAAPVKLDKPVAAKADDRKNGDKAAADKAAADKASTEKTADKMVLDKAAADKAAADKAAADKLAADKQKRAEKSLFAEALAADKP